MFTAHPEVIDMFSFVTTKDLVQLQKEPRFHKHVDNLMKSVGVAVDTLDNPEQMAKTLKALGKRHIKYNATIQQMAVRIFIILTTHYSLVFCIWG